MGKRSPQTQAKRRREQAKREKRKAKDERRAARKADRESAASVSVDEHASTTEQSVEATQGPLRTTGTSA